MHDSFIIESITWHEVSDIVDVHPIHTALNTLDITKYGRGVEHIHFTYVAVRPSNTNHPQTIAFDEESRVLSLTLPLSYPHLLSADRQTVLTMMARLFLIAIEVYTTSLHDFDRTQFQEDVAALFMSKGWISKPKAAGQ